MWVQDFELMCKKHRLEHKKEFEKALRLRINADSSKKNKRKVKRKKDDIETES